MTTITLTEMPPGCWACPPGCRDCTGDQGTCECYEHDSPVPDPATEPVVVVLLDALETLSAEPVGSGVWIGRLSTGHRILIRRRPQGKGGDLS